MAAGRATTAYVSAFTRDRVAQCFLRERERRPLIANFRALLPAGETIERATWDMDCLTPVAMADAAIDGPAAQVTITAVDEGETAIRVEVELSGGQVFNQVFYVRVECGPAFTADSVQAGGPARLIVEAEPPEPPAPE